MQRLGGTNIPLIIINVKSGLFNSIQVYLYTAFPFPFSHFADAFIQNDLQLGNIIQLGNFHDTNCCKTALQKMKDSTRY